MKIYLSHKISAGNENASNVEMYENCKKAVEISEQIKVAIPSIDLYVPGGQTEEFVQIALKKVTLQSNRFLMLTVPSLIIVMQ